MLLDSLNIQNIFFQLYSISIISTQVNEDNPWSHLDPIDSIIRNFNGYRPFSFSAALTHQMVPNTVREVILGFLMHDFTLRQSIGNACKIFEWHKSHQYLELFKKSVESDHLLFGRFGDNNEHFVRDNSSERVRKDYDELNDHLFKKLNRDMKKVRKKLSHISRKIQMERQHFSRSLDQKSSSLVAALKSNKISIEKSNSLELKKTIDQFNSTIENNTRNGSATSEIIKGKHQHLNNLSGVII